MNKRTLKNHLYNVFDSWASSIVDTRLRRDVWHDAVIAGGAIASLLLGDEPNDYDIYFTDPNLALRVAKYYTENMDSQFYDYVPTATLENNKVTMNLGPRAMVLPKKPWPETDEYKVTCITDHAISLTNKIQLCVGFIDNPERLVSRFDFEHTKCHWISRSNTLVLPEKSLESILMKNLVYSGCDVPINALLRTRKFLERGWRIDAGQYLKIVFDINEINLEDPETLEYHLVGLDNSYFETLLSFIRREKEKDEDFLIYPDYIRELIDRIENGDNLEGIDFRAATQ